MIEEMQTQHQEKTYLWSPEASYQARTHGWQNSTGNCSPAPTSQHTKAEESGCAGRPEQGIRGWDTHTHKIQLPVPITRDEPQAASI